MGKGKQAGEGAPVAGASRRQQAREGEGRGRRGDGRRGRGFAPVQIQPREGGGGREVLGRRGGVAEEDGGAVGVAMGGVGSAGSIPIQIGSGEGEWERVGNGLGFRVSWGAHV